MPGWHTYHSGNTTFCVPACSIMVYSVLQQTRSLVLVVARTAPTSERNRSSTQASLCSRAAKGRASDVVRDFVCVDILACGLPCAAMRRGRRPPGPAIGHLPKRPRLDVALSGAAGAGSCEGEELPPRLSLRCRAAGAAAGSPTSRTPTRSTASTAAPQGGRAGERQPVRGEHGG